jgi:hypothetical protein
MADWYERLHPWNRVVLTSLIVTLIVRGALSSLTIDSMIVTPCIAASLWLTGWLMIGARNRIRKLRVTAHA